MGVYSKDYIRVMEKETILKSKEKDTIYPFLMSTCLAVGVVGICLYFEVDYLDMAAYGVGLWGLFGLLNMDAIKEKFKT
mgnify:CR=1 FL=1|tara:strand:- start:276 stop:512 length:237 start_codon:yes stop_codon:yes gene_type:complete